MALYSLSLRTSSSTSGTPFWACMCPAGMEATVHELRAITTNSVNTPTWGLGLSTNVPVFTSPVTVIAEDPQRPAGRTTCAVAFSTAPIAPQTFFRRSISRSAIGEGIVWVFTRGIVLPEAGRALALWHLGAAIPTPGQPLCDVDVVVDE